MSWERKRLDELGSISRGRSKHRPRNDPALYNGEYPFIQTADVKNSNFYITDYTQTYNERGLSQSKLWNKGTLCITIAANIADTGILGMDACFPDSIMGFIPYDDKSDVRFIKYCFDILQKNCQQISQGATQDNLSWEKLSTILFPAPSLKTQKRIADILSTYDELIEKNQKQLKLLEEAAQRLYKEWFVDLRFPGYENTPIVDGVPKGWTNGMLSDIALFKRGKTITKKQVISGNVPVVAGGKEPACYHNVSNTAAPVITISASGNAGFVRLYHERVWASDCSWLDYSNTKYLYFVYNLLKFKQDDIYSMQKGACQQHVNANDINSLKIIIPSSDLLENYENIVTPLFNKIEGLYKQIELSKQARDRLLPKLMSGELEVCSW